MSCFHEVDVMFLKSIEGDLLESSSPEATVCRLLQNRCLCWSLFLIKLWAGLQLYLKRFQYRCFPVNIAKFSRTSFLQNTFSGCFRES